MAVKPLRLSLLEEAKSPTQFVDELADGWKRLRTALTRADYVQPDHRYRVGGHDVVFRSYVTAGKQVAVLVSFPDCDDLDIRIIRTPDLVPEAVVTQFVISSGKTWVRRQTRFQFDDADAVRRVMDGLTDVVMKLIEAQRDDEDSEGYKSTDPNVVTRSITNVEKKTVKVVTGRRKNG